MVRYTQGVNEAAGPQHPGPSIHACQNGAVDNIQHECLTVKAAQTTLQAEICLHAAGLQQPATLPSHDTMPPPHTHFGTQVCVRSPATATGAAIAAVRALEAAALSAVCIVLFAISSAMQSSGSLR